MKNKAPKCKVGDLVRIPHYSSLFGSHQSDSAVDRQMRKVIYRVTDITHAICGDDNEGWFDNLDLVDHATGERFPYMIINSSVELVLA